jgi:type IV pilus assembly protein PilQ
MSNKRKIYRMALVLVLTAGLAGLVGCATDKPTRTDQAIDEWQAKAQNSKGFSPVRDARSQALADRALKSQMGKPLRPEQIRPLPNQRITIKFQDIDVSVALRAIAKAVNQNILINAKVEGVISLEAQDEPWSQVFLSILRSQGLSYAWEGKILRIVTADALQKDMQTRVVPIEYADAGKLRDNIQAILAGSAPPVAPEAGADDSKTKAVPVFPGTVLVDEHSNALVIQAGTEDIARLLPLIEALDRPTPQIFIEAHIVEATKDAARQLGVQWGGLVHDISSDDYLTSGGTSTGVNGQTLTQGINPTIGQAANFPATFGANALGFTMGYIMQEAGEQVLMIQLSALQEDGKVNILSSPSITTLDNQPAIIESGAEVPFQTVDANGNIDIEWKKATLKLEVTPHVIKGDILKLKILTKKDELDFTRPVLGNPTIITKNAETSVVLANGQTTVIGGLNKETVSDSETGIPWLKDIPGLGHLFKTTSTSNDFEDVLIFITPHILAERSTAGLTGVDIKPGE